MEGLPPVARERAEALLRLGGAPADMLAAHPEDAASLEDLSLGALPPAELSSDERLARLRRLRRRHMLAVAGAELSGAISHDEAARRLSDAADALLDAVLDAVRVLATRELAVAVLALGKLGGRELNYSSDVDLVVVRADDAPVVPTEQLVRAFVRALEALPEEGRLYRTDLRLRPEGSTGAIAPRLSTALEYYARSGRTWERQAFLKARVAAGDRALGAKLLAGLETFLWGTRLDARAIEEILGLRARIEAKAGASAERNVKEGPGGIRDVEYSVQFLQLLHGKETRATGTLEAIERLEAANVVRPEEARALRESYGLLRRVEHALQLTRDRELKQVPADDEARRLLARALGFELAEFDANLMEARTRARRTLDVLLRKPFGTTSPHPNPPSATREEGAGVLQIRDFVLSGGDAGAALRGFKDPGQAARDLEALANEKSPYLAPSGRARTLLAGLAPRLLDHLGRAPDPDAALRNLVRATATLGAKATFYELLLENPDALELFCSLAAASDFLVETLARRPGVFDEVVDRLLTGTHPSRDEIIAEARVALAREDGPEALRDVRAVHLLLVGIRDVSGRANAQNTGRDLAVLAEGVLEALLERARATVALRRGGAPEVAFAALALGKLGSQALSYSSDLDLLFVVENASALLFFEDVAREALRLGEGTASAEGPLYPIDLRLRPAGGKGSLVATLDATRSYYRGEGTGEHAADWERLALQKLRPVAGDEAFALRAASVLRDDLYAHHYEGLRKAALDMRARQVEVAGDDDLKRAPGGLADVEFLASALALEHGRAIPALRETNTARLLSALRDADLLSPGDHVDLMTAYQFLRRVELRLRVALARAESKVSRDHAERRALALRLGYVDAGATAEEQLARELAYSKGRVRAIFERVLNREP